MKYKTKKPFKLNKLRYCFENINYKISWSLSLTKGKVRYSHFHPNCKYEDKYLPTGCELKASKQQEQQYIEWRKGKGRQRFSPLTYWYPFGFCVCIYLLLCILYIVYNYSTFVFVDASIISVDSKQALENWATYSCMNVECIIRRIRRNIKFTVENLYDFNVLCSTWFIWFTHLLLLLSLSPCSFWTRSLLIALQTIAWNDEFEEQPLFRLNDIFLM